MTVVFAGFLIMSHDAIEQKAFNAGLSWTFSKIVPYIVIFLLALVGFTAAIQIFHKKAVGYLVGLVLFSAICGTDFATHLIYNGDFSNNYQTIQSNDPQFVKGTLSVIAIPGCPFCHGSVEPLKVLKKRNPNLPINFYVFSKDSTDLVQYVQPIDGKYNLALFKNLKELVHLGINSFPTFIFSDKNGKKYLWTNDNFGAPAKDFIEKNVK